MKQQEIRLHTATVDRAYTQETDLSILSTYEGVEISIVSKGSGIHRILDQVDECHAGDVYILGGGLPHGYFAGGNGERPTVLTLRFDPAAVLDGEWANPDSDHFCCGVFRDRVPVSYAMLNGQMTEQVTALWENLTTELGQKPLAWPMAARATLVTLLVTLSRYINMADTAKPARPKDWQLVSSAIRQVVEGCDDSELTLETIATTLFVSPSHLSRLFRRITGTSFLDYLRHVRIERACVLLRTTSLPNQEIVGRCGLKDIPSFYRLFKAQMGVTPYQYRMSTEGETGMSIYAEISENLQRGKSKLVQELVQKAVDDGLPAAQILNEGLLAGMSVIGEKFKNNQVYVPEVLVAARAMNMGVQILKPLLVDDGAQSAGRVCIGTVQGDLHDIGKNLVKMMMEGKGLEVIDLGVDVAPDQFVQAAIDNECQVICCSALLTTTMEIMEDVVRQAEAAGIRDKVKIMVGGAPVSQEFCDKIGADCYTVDAASAADAAVELCGV